VCGRKRADLGLPDLCGRHSERGDTQEEGASSMGLNMAKRRTMRAVWWLHAPNHKYGPILASSSRF